MCLRVQCHYLQLSFKCLAKGSGEHLQQMLASGKVWIKGIQGFTMLIFVPLSRFEVFQKERKTTKRAH